MTIKNILIVKMSALGDVIMTIPALEALKKLYPSANIDWLVEEVPAPILEDHFALRRVIILPKNNLKKLWKQRKYLTAIKVLKNFIKDLRKEKYDLVIDLQGLLKSAICARLARSNSRYGYANAREGASFFYNFKFPAYNPEMHALERYLQAVSYLGAESNVEEKYINIPAKYLEEADSLTPQNYIVLNSGTTWESKKWPLNNWQKLGEMIKKELNLDVVLTGGSAEVKDCAIINRSGQFIDLSGQRHLKTLGGIFQKAKAVISCDTGPMHLASAVGAKGIALFGSTKANRTGPYSKSIKVVTPQVECLGCLKKKCPFLYSCLSKITPEYLIDELKKIIL